MIKKKLEYPESLWIKEWDSIIQEVREELRKKK